ncbi:lysylphosphatidylglycerol synthase transmembrane domain-containing protein [Faecalibacter bovis]|uniref:Flippase-like domain-containing protein n=1 Tax=Faecalibacter bovis TaxID=2898187 RepID=A0ABX7XDX0_9FLAO|nr:lysylphosphatidylglycerol synthase transmembrane domain-containing protein [Faecalibacter bovis]QTV06104.1 flippase-like domain-containing protein [Faecalibacter bovis]
MNNTLNQKTKKYIVTGLKLAISFILIYYVFFIKLHIFDILANYKNANWFYIAVAIILYILSQALSVFRLDYYFRDIDLDLSYISNVRLYFLGMFYNTFVPGGIGGDAYKVYVLNKNYKISLKEISQAVFLDKIIGLCAMLLIIIFLVYFSNLTDIPIIQYGALGSSLIGFIAVPIILGIIFPKHKKTFFNSMIYSIVLQLIQVGMLYFVLEGLNIQPENFSIYLLIFLFSGILSIISFSGFGIREVVFMYAANRFNFDETLATSAAFMFSVITISIAFIGIIYLFKGVKIEEKKKSIKISN